MKVFHQVQNEEYPLAWYIRGIPDHGFYQDLHQFIEMSPLMRKFTKVSIGKFYMSVDHNLKSRGFRSINAYRFIDRLVSQKHPRNSIVNYHTEESDSCLKTQMRECSNLAQQLMVEIEELRRERDAAKQQLNDTEQVLKETVREVKVVTKQFDAAKKQLVSCKKSYEAAVNEIASLNEAYYDMEVELSEALASVEKELLTITEASTIFMDKNGSFCFMTKSGRKQYLPAVRRLYYSLLADQIPPSKIRTTIKMVLKCFLPNLNVDDLQLPKERCAGYMRADELTTVSLAHKASAISEKAEKMSGMLHMNTDGTTLQQKKINGVVIDDIVISVGEQVDGTSDSIVDHVSKELQKLREMARDLGLPNSESINWTLISCSTSDSASNQKKFNKLVEKCKEVDQEKFGSNYSPESSLEIIENFCAMHLGCNLRKAFLQGIKHTHTCEQTGSSNRDYNLVDTLVYEFYKVFGKYGTPEYGSGVLHFPDFLKLMCSDNSLNAADASYYQSCLSLSLDRQIGSRYFVTAANAAKIMYLKKATIAFLEFTQRGTHGNKLEKDLYIKLQDPIEVRHLKVDALMFCHVYADLVCLAKSVELRKCVLDMNTHYFELLTFLKELQKVPECVFNQDLCVFKSEKKLYSDDPKFNHRLRSNFKLFQDSVFGKDEEDSALFLQLVTDGAIAREKKLSEYATTQLPGGLYWEPDPEVRAVLEGVQPSNDVCEAILGLNDYLNSAIPNMNQETRSNLVELKKNKTVAWLDGLPEDKQDMVVKKAVASRRKVADERRQESEKRAELRRQKLLQEHLRRKILQERADKERAKLSEAHLITSSAELYSTLQSIDEEDATAGSKRLRKLAVLKTQVKIRKKILNQDIRIVFTSSRRQRPINEIVKELSEFITANSSNATMLNSPTLLIGKPIKHCFQIDDLGEERWYNGVILKYDDSSKQFEIVYEGDDAHYYFDLSQDVMLGDLVLNA